MWRPARLSGNSHALLPPRLVPSAPRRDLAEIEAESVAFIVCNALGIDSASYTLPYVAKWAGGDVERIRSTAERVVTTAQAVLAAMAPAVDSDAAVSA